MYDVTNFLDEHLGGKKILQRVLGQDASKQFWKYHNEKVMAKWGTPLKIGSIGSSDNTPKAISKTTPSTNYSPPRPKLQPAPHVPSPPTDNKPATEIFGEVLSPHQIYIDPSSSHLRNPHGTQGSLPPITMPRTIVSDNLCVHTWRIISSPTSLNGKKRNSNPKHYSNKSHNKDSSQQPCSLSLPRNT